MDSIDKYIHDKIEEIVAIRIKDILSEMPESSSRERKQVYSNKEVLAMLDVDPKVLKRYRDSGMLGYSKCGDKYFYTWDDIDAFLKHNHHSAYAYEVKKGS